MQFKSNLTSPSTLIYPIGKTGSLLASCEGIPFAIPTECLHELLIFVSLVQLASSSLHILLCMPKWENSLRQEVGADWWQRPEKVVNVGIGNPAPNGTIRIRFIGVGAFD
ncbi:MLO-like protein 1-like protein [Anopheles sinensis]|uniref:MLO-like protein 1-like protein n=1 Tax=Anopheles sinensis TaxID=74873 RepID=A0A084VT82_ANOSI|nr:MLO-like protein 1-like protein [Anopheles sinensis]